MPQTRVASGGKPPIGSRPGTLVLPQGSPAPTIQRMHYDEAGVRVETVADPRALSDVHEASGVTWIDVQGLGDEAVLRSLGEIFNLHRLALEDVVHVPIRPKVEAFDRHVLIVTRMVLPGTDAVEFLAEQVSIFLGRNYVLTFQERPGDVLDPVRRRIQVDGSVIRRSGADYLAYAVLDTIIDAYYPLVEQIGNNLEALEDRVLRAADPATLRELTRQKGTLVQLRRAISPQREAVNALIRDPSPFVGDEVRVYFRDTYDHVVHTAEAVEVSREAVNGLMNTYLSVVSNRMNEVMKTLTIVASIFVPLTFMAGIYGMNFETMPELHVWWAYPLLLGSMGLVAFGMLVYFWRKGWIAGSRGADD